METIFYLCPSCKGHLNVNESIVLIIKDQKGNQGITFLHTELGNYTSQMSSSLNIKKGDPIEFYCPYCHANIEFYKEKSNLAKLTRLDSNKKETQVIFSKIYGEECTYHIEEKDIKTYGLHAVKYMDPEWFLK